MAKKKITTKYPDGWVVATEMTINNRIVSVGTELSISGEQGRFRFVKHVKTQTCEWIDVIGGKKGYSTFRSFRINQVRTVHWKNKTADNLIKERKEKIAEEKKVTADE